MVMVCPNCHSHEIIAVQGQNFCISCGQIIEDAPAAASVPEAKPKRGPGRPRKAKLDVAITHLPPDTAAPAADPPVQTPPKPAALQPSAPPLPAAPQMAPRSMTDVRPTASAPAAADHNPSQTQARVAHPAIGMGAAWTALIQPLNYVQSLPAALALLLPAGIAWANLDALSNWQSLSSPQMLALTAQLVVAAALAIMMWLISTGAIIFGEARRQDHRGGSGLIWARAAAAAMPKLALAAAAQTAIAVVVAAALMMLIRYGSLDLALPPLAAAAAVLLMAVLSGYLLAGVWVAGHLAGAVLILTSKATAGRALSLGWNGWRHHFELLTGWILAMLPTAALTVGLAWLLAPYSYSRLADPVWLTQAAVALVVCTIVLAVQTGAAAQASYRHVVTADRFGQAGNLLMSRSPQRVPKFAPAPLVSAVLGAAVIVALQLILLR